MILPSSTWLHHTAKERIIKKKKRVKKEALEEQRLSLTMFDLARSVV
jgi:hypothetical protein